MDGVFASKVYITLQVYTFRGKSPHDGVIQRNPPRLSAQASAYGGEYGKGWPEADVERLSIVLNQSLREWKKEKNPSITNTQ